MENSLAQVSKQPEFMPIREAFLRRKEAIAAVPQTDLIPVNVDLQTLTTNTRGRIGRLTAFRERIVKELPTADVTALDNLEDFVMALTYTHSQYRASSTPAEHLPELQAEAANCRDILYCDAVALDKRGIIDGAKLKELRGTNGYQGTAFELLTVYTVLRDNWDKIEGKTALTSDELERAGAVADELMIAVGIRESAPQAMAEVILTRQRAFTLFAKAYDEVRRCITFLRWKEGDADEIAPSLYSGRRKKPVRVVPPTGDGGEGGEDEEGGEDDPIPVNGSSPPQGSNPAPKPADDLPGASPFEMGHG